LDTTVGWSSTDSPSPSPLAEVRLGITEKDVFARSGTDSSLDASKDLRVEALASAGRAIDRR
jgi:hypothetical protein